MTTTVDVCGIDRLTLMWTGIGLLGVVFYWMTSQSRHRFDPRPDKPNECRMCGRRRDKHPA